ncbi:MAG: restriction endonuclease subunit S [Candidatus Sumerlaeota bacterium]|nr:restriction endonuclease subunit S [Candidatus Sumerlaeota bacterium]
MATNTANSKMLNGWRMARLHDLCHIVMGQSPPSSTYNSVRDGLPFFQGKAEFTELYPEVRKWCNAPAKVAKQNDVLISVRAPVGPTNLASSDCCIGRGLAALSPRDGIESRYILYMMRCFESHLASLGQGTTFQAISGKTLRDFPVIYAPLEDQRRIVARIEELFSDLDAGVAALKRAQANLKRYRAAVLKAAVEGKLTEQWRKDNPPRETAAQLLARILAERRRKWEAAQLAKYTAAGKTPPKDWKAKYKTPAPPDTSCLPSLPDGWIWVSIAQIGETTTGSTPPKQNPEFFGGNIPFFKPTDLDAGYNVREFRDSLTESGMEHGRILPPLSILVTCIGATIGKTGLARVRCATNQQINALTVVADLISPEFTYWLFASPFGQSQIISNASATTLPILNKSRFEALSFPLPPVEEQRQIVSEIEWRLSIVEKLEVVVSVSFQRASHLRHSILRYAFDDRLVQNKQPLGLRVSQLAPHKLNINKLRKSQDMRSGVAAIMGAWPGGETDEEIEHEIDAIS